MSRVVESLVHNIHPHLLEFTGKGYIISSTVVNLQSRIASKDRLLGRLLLQVRLNTPLPRLSIIVLLLRLSLLRIVARQPSNSASNRPANTILNTLSKIRHLSLRLLTLALLVLASTLLLEPLGAHESANALLQRTDVLVPAASAAVRVVLCDAARGGGGEGSSLCCCVREILLGGGFGFAVLALRLVGLDGLT
jgi:hypothetical protein